MNEEDRTRLEEFPQFRKEIGGSSEYLLVPFFARRRSSVHPPSCTIEIRPEVTSAPSTPFTDLASHRGVEDGSGASYLHLGFPVSPGGTAILSAGIMVGAPT